MDGSPGSSDEEYNGGVRTEREGVLKYQRHRYRLMAIVLLDSELSLKYFIEVRICFCIEGHSIPNHNNPPSKLN